LADLLELPGHLGFDSLLVISLVELRDELVDVAMDLAGLAEYLFDLLRQRFAIHTTAV